MKPFHGYPQHPDADPERPWWRRLGNTRRRSDGVTLFWGPLFVGGVCIKGPDSRGLLTSDEAGDVLFGHGLAMERIDREHPLPAPLPLCGQVWVLGERGLMIVDDGDGQSSPPSFQYGGAIPEWPPPNMALACGPLSPWAPRPLHPGDLVRLRGPVNPDHIATVDALLPGGVSLRWSSDGGKTWGEPATASTSHVVRVEPPSCAEVAQ